MAILKDFVDQVSFDEVWALLGHGKENMQQYKEAYQSIYQELQAAVPAENTDHMTIKFVMEDAPQWEFFFDDEPEDQGADAKAEAAEEEDEGPTLQVCGFIPGGCILCLCIEIAPSLLRLINLAINRIIPQKLLMRAYSVDLACIQHYNKIRIFN